MEGIEVTGINGIFSSGYPQNRREETILVISIRSTENKDYEIRIPERILKEHYEISKPVLNEIKPGLTDLLDKYDASYLAKILLVASTMKPYK